MNAPTAGDVRKAIAYAEQNLRLGEHAADDTEANGRFKQAEQALGPAMRSPAASSRPPRSRSRAAGGLDLALPGTSARGALSGPGLR